MTKRVRFFLCLFSIILLFPARGMLQARDKAPGIADPLTDSPFKVRKKTRKKKKKELKKVIKEKKKMVVKYVDEDIYIRLIGALPSGTQRSVVLSVQDQIDVMFELFGEYSKVPEYRIDSIYGHFAGSRDIIAGRDEVPPGAVVLYCIWSAFSTDAQGISFLPYDTAANGPLYLSKIERNNIKSVFCLVDVQLSNHTAEFNAATPGDLSGNSSYIYLGKNWLKEMDLQEHYLGFFTNHTGADYSIRKENSSFSDLFRHFNSNTSQFMQTNISNTVFVPYSWVGGTAETNYVTKYIYEYRTNAATEESVTKNFITYDTIKEAEIVKEKVGVEIEYDIVYKDGKWE